MVTDRQAPGPKVMSTAEQEIFATLKISQICGSNRLANFWLEVVMILPTP